MKRLVLLTIIIGSYGYGADLNLIGFNVTNPLDVPVKFEAQGGTKNDLFELNLAGERAFNIPANSTARIEFPALSKGRPYTNFSFTLDAGDRGSTNYNFNNPSVMGTVMSNVNGQSFTIVNQQGEPVIPEFSQLDQISVAQLQQQLAQAGAKNSELMAQIQQKDGELQKRDREIEQLKQAAREVEQLKQKLQQQEAILNQFKELARNPNLM